MATGSLNLVVHHIKHIDTVLTNSQFTLAELNTLKKVFENFLQGTQNVIDRAEEKQKQDNDKDSKEG